MALAADSDDHHPNRRRRHHLTLDSLPHIDLRLLSQSDLYSLSVTSASGSPSPSSSRRFDDDVLIPKIDRSVFNESAGSRKQTYSRLRLAPRNSQFQIPKPKPKSQTAPISQPRDRETLQIITLLKQLFPSDDDAPDDVVSAAALEPSAARSSLVDLHLDADDGSQRKRKRGRPRMDSDVVVDDTSAAIVLHGSDGKRGRKASVKGEEAAAAAATEMVMENGNGVVVDLEGVANADESFGEAVRRRTEGMATEAELLGFLRGLAGDWSSARKKRKIVEASEFCDALPRQWKINLALKRGGGRVWLFCRRYISPNGQQFMSCKEVSAYLISYFEVRNQSKLGHADGNIDFSDVMVSGDDTNLAVKDENKSDELVSCSLVPNTSVSTGREKPETLLHVENSLEIQAGDARGMRPNETDLGLSEQGSDFSLTNDMSVKVDEATRTGPSSGVHLVYQRASNNQKKDCWEHSGEASVVNCFRDVVNDDAKASVSSFNVPNMDTDSALTGTGKDRRIDNTANSQLTSKAENTKPDVNDSANGRSVTAVSESCIGPNDAYTNVKQQSTSGDSQRGLYRTFTDDKFFDESNNFISESFRTSYEPEFDDIGLSRNNIKTVRFGSNNAMPDVDEHVISTESCSDVPAVDRQSCITLSDAKNPNCPVEELWKQKSSQSNVSNPLVKQARVSSETGMLFPSGYVQSYNMVNNVNSSSSSLKESEKEEKRSGSSEAFLARGHGGVGANSMTITALEDNLTGSVNGLMHPSGNEQTPLFENNQRRDYSSIMWEQPNPEGAEKSGNIEPTNVFLNNSQSSDAMEELMWRMDEQNGQSRLGDTSAALVLSSGCYSNFDMLSGQGANGAVSVSENFDSMSDLEGLKLGLASSHSTESKVLTYDGEMEQGFNSSGWLGKESLPAVPNISRSFQIKNCSWCRNDFYHEFYEAETQTGSVGIMCPTCQAKFSSQYNFL